MPPDAPKHVTWRFRHRRLGTLAISLLLLAWWYVRAPLTVERVANVHNIPAGPLALRSFPISGPVDYATRRFSRGTGHWISGKAPRDIVRDYLSGLRNSQIRYFSGKMAHDEDPDEHFLRSECLNFGLDPAVFLLNRSGELWRWQCSTDDGEGRKVSLIAWYCPETEHLVARTYPSE